MWARILLTLAVAALVASWPRPARAWVESTVVSDLATIDLDREGSAQVSHELVLRVRGGLLTALVLDGVDLDAEPASDGVVQSVRVGSTPIPLLLVKSDDGSLRLEIDHPKGLRTGSYLFRFGYRTRLLDRDLIRIDGDGVEVRWIGPRFADGIDSVKASFRIPSAAIPPRLIDQGSELGGGVFLSSLRRGADKDELEIVRPHVAKGEPVVWRVWASAKAFDAFEPPAVSRAPSAPSQLPEQRPLRRLIVFGGAALAALAYASLVWLKARAEAARCRLASASPAPLIPLPPVWRAAAAGACAAGAPIAGALTETAGWFGAALLGAGLLATSRPAELRALPRGPGRWLPVSDRDAFAAPPPATRAARWLDATTWPGRFTLGTLLAVDLLIAGWVGRRSAYHGCLVALALFALLPIFLSGTRHELPIGPGEPARRLLAWLAKALRSRAGFKVVPLLRIPLGARDADELRLLLVPKPAVRGLIAVELAVEQLHGWGRPLPLPCVLVRAREGSEAHACLPRSAVWTRGRKPEERVAILRPPVPGREACLRLALDVVQAVTAHGAPPDKSSRMSSGIGSSTLKPARLELPDHASLLA